MEVPEIAEQDKRLLLVKKTADEDEREREESEWDEEDEEYEEELDAESIPPKKRSKSTPDTLTGFLKDQTKEQLISLLVTLQENIPSSGKTCRTGSIWRRAL